jgi:DMSO/TMAO reductase YedYZ molybdopterin-dependent catalytic subunit
MTGEPFIARDFRRRGDRIGDASRLPPGQYETKDFPVLSAGPTPRTPLARWDFTIRDVDGNAVRWTWDEFLSLPRDEPVVDIHCVTKWSKFGTRWQGVTIDVLLSEAASQHVNRGPVLQAICDGGYTTNLTLDDVSGGKAWIAFGYDSAPLPAEHGGPARLLVPHLYFWKSAKWVRELRFMRTDIPGFWEANGYHNRGDPWREQRYQGDP